MPKLSDQCARIANKLIRNCLKAGGWFKGERGDRLGVGRGLEVGGGVVRGWGDGDKGGRGGVKMVVVYT